MILLTTLIVIVCLTSLLIPKIENYELEGALEILRIIAGILLLLSIVTIPIFRNNFYGDVERLKAFKSTIQNSRKENLSEIERAAILKDIAEWNQEIASNKYYNNHGFDLWIPDEINRIEFIK